MFHVLNGYTKYEVRIKSLQPLEDEMEFFRDQTQKWMLGK